MNDEHKVCQRLVVVWALVLPTLFKEIVEVVPLLELEDSFELQLDDLEVL